MIEGKYKELCEKESDINQHLPTIRETVKEGDNVLELGVRDVVSTWALLANKPATLLSVDVVYPPEQNLRDVADAARAQDTAFDFILASSLHLQLKKNVDVLFVDTIHTYSQLVKELWRFESKVKRTIILHDTKIPEMWACVTDFLYSPNWQIEKQLDSHMGLTVLTRI